jgi:hypothetical protein
MVTRVWGVEEADAERGGGEGGVGARARPGVAATTSRRSTLSAHLLGPADDRGDASETRFTARNAALGAAVDFRVVSETHSCGLFSLSFSGNRRGRAAALPRCGGGIRAATVRPRTRLSRRGLRAFTERDGQESQRKTPPGCVSPALVAEPRPAPRAIRRFLGTAAAGADSRETMRRRRARRRANSLNDAFVIKRGRGRSRDVASRRRSRARLGDCLSRPRRERVTMSAPRRPSRRRRSPPPLFPSSQIRRQVLLPGEGAGLPLARVVQARAAEPQV